MRNARAQKLVLTYLLFLGLPIVLGIHGGVKKDVLKPETETKKNGLTLSSSPTSASASSCGNVEVALTPSTGVYNDEITVSINISNNQCEICTFAFDLLYETSLFSYQGIERQNCLTSDWTMVDGNEITPGQLRIGGFAGSASCIQQTENGCLLTVKLKVIAQCGIYQDGYQSLITINSYTDDFKSYSPQPAQVVFSLICCGGNISLPSDLTGTAGDEIHIPVIIADNDNQICDFTFDFVFDPSVFEFKGIERSSVTQDWSTMDWSQVESGKIRITGSAGSGTCVPSLSSACLVKMKLMVKCVGYTSDTQTPIRIEEYNDGISLLCPRSFEVNFSYKSCPRLGDVNGDGLLTPGDAQEAFDIYLGRNTPSFCQLTTADANCSCPCNGKEHTQQNHCITPSDAQWIFDHFLGRLTLSLCCADYHCSSSSVMNLSEAPPFSPIKRMVYALPTIGNSEERVKVPIMVNNPERIRSFSLEMAYPHELLEYVGLKASPLTRGFAHVKGEEIWPGIIRIEGKGEKPIKGKKAGSLAVAIFHVKKGFYRRAPLVLYNLDGDIFSAETRNSWFVRHKYLKGKERYLSLGEGKEIGEMMVIPVEVTNAFDVKAFGLEVKYPAEKMTFIGVNPTHLTKDFLAVDGNEIEKGVVRIGGYSMSGIQDMFSGVLVELVFKVKELGAKIEIVKVMDDLEEFVVIH